MQFSNVILRRRKLGRTSCREIKRLSQEIAEVIRNDKYSTISPTIDMLFRWGCTSQVDAKIVINIAEAIHLVSDKTLFRQKLQEKELCPTTWFDFNDTNISFPCIVRPRKHHQGRKLYLVNNKGQLIAACTACGQGYYINKFIDKVSEYRVFVVQGRVVCVAKKSPKDENTVAWNVAQGGVFENVSWNDWPLKACKKSIQAFNLSGLDFGGVDVMIDAKGNCYILEINSAPSLTSPYRQQCFAKAFDYIVKNGKKHFTSIDDLPKGNYKKFIHPAILNNIN